MAVRHFGLLVKNTDKDGKNQRYNDRIMKVIKTNWINLLGVFLTVFLYAVILNQKDVNV